MDISPYLSAISRFYELTRLPDVGGIRIRQARRRGIIKGDPFFIAFTDLFYLPENEHKIRQTLSGAELPLPHSWMTPKILVICSYNGMIDISRDDLRSFTDRALINYLLLERESGVWIGEDRFYRGGSDEPRRIRRILEAL